MKNHKFSPKEQDQAHQLKILPMYYIRALTNEKPWELRMNDRDFQTGDFISLNEYDPSAMRYTGNNIDAKITYVFTSPKYGLKKGYCIFTYQKL